MRRNVSREECAAFPRLEIVELGDMREAALRECRLASAGTTGPAAVADENTERGSVQSIMHVLAQQEIVGPDLAEALQIGLQAPIFHSVIVHMENELPIQLEDRYVNPAIAPLYLDQDFSQRTPNDYLIAVAPISRTGQFVEAVLPQAWECRLMAIASGEPCLMVRRRTWSGEAIVTTARLLYPGSRYRLETAF